MRSSSVQSPSPSSLGLGTADATAGRPHPPASPVTAGSLTTVRQSTVVCPDVRGGVDRQQVTWVRAAGSGEGIAAGQPTITATSVTAQGDGLRSGRTRPRAVPVRRRVRRPGRQGHAGAGLHRHRSLSSRPGRRPDDPGHHRRLSAASRPRLRSSRARSSPSSAARPRVGNQLKLVLTNVDAATASVDIDAVRQGGPSARQGTQGVQVAPHTRRTIDLVKLGPSKNFLTTMVTAVTGRVAAAVLTSRRTGDTAARHRVAARRRSGRPPGARARHDGRTGKRTLVHRQPRATVTANVAVQVVSDTGTFTPAGLEQQVASRPAAWSHRRRHAAPWSAIRAHCCRPPTSRCVAGASQELTSTRRPTPPTSAGRPDAQPQRHGRRPDRAGQRGGQPRHLALPHAPSTTTGA